MLKIVALGEKNPRSKGARVYVEGVEWSAAQGEADFVACGGPADAQRVIFATAARRRAKRSKSRRAKPAAGNYHGVYRIRNV